MISGRRCAACKYLRRKCPQNCIFSAYFPSNDPQRFAMVHRIYGAKNVVNMLQELPVACRAQAANSMGIKAPQRVEDPVYGCVRIISQLHQEIQNLETQLAKTRAEIAIIGSNNINVQDQISTNDHDHQPFDGLEYDLNCIIVHGLSNNNSIEQLSLVQIKLDGYDL